MEIHQLRYFVRIAEVGNFTRAAADLAVAQPSLSQQLRKLERELGFRLFERSPARVRLTSEGELFLPHARAILDRLREATLAAAEIRGVQQGRVSIGVSPIAGARVLPRLLRAVAERFPKLSVETREGGLGRLLDLLESGEIDLAMVRLPTTVPNVVCTTVLSEDLVLVVREGHALAARDAVSFDDLVDEQFVLLTPEFGVRQLVVEECERAGFTPQIVLESREVSIVQGMVEAGLGVTILPEGAVRRDLATVTRPVLSNGERPRRAIGLAMRSDRYVPLAARRVFDLVRDLFGPADVRVPKGDDYSVEQDH